MSKITPVCLLRPWVIIVCCRSIGDLIVTLASDPISIRLAHTRQPPNWPQSQAIHLYSHLEKPLRGGSNLSLPPPSPYPVEECQPLPCKNILYQAGLGNRWPCLFLAVTINTAPASRSSNPLRSLRASLAFD